MAKAAKKSVAKPAGAKRARTTKHNYDQAQQWFVEGMPVDPDEPDGDRDWPNLRVLAEKTNIPYARVRERAAADRWTELKNRHQQEAAKDRQKRRQDLMGKQGIELDQRSADISKLGLQLVGVRLSEIATAVQMNKDLREAALQRQRDGLPVERHEVWSQVRADELERLAKAAATLQDIGRKALGLDIQQINVQGEVSVAATISVAQELERDDPDRLAGFMAAAERAGLWEQLELSGPDEEEEPSDIVEGEVVGE